MALFCCFEWSGSFETALAVDPFDRSATIVAAGVFAHCRIGAGVNDWTTFFLEHS